MLDYLIKKHSPKVALQFSGGKDSLALLYFLMPYWDRLTVYHVNTGDQLPETSLVVDRVRKLVPSFVEVMGRQPEVIEKQGWPSDIVLSEDKWKVGGLKVQDTITCCYLSHMRPMHLRMLQDGIQLVIRGQRLEDTHRSPVQNGQVIDGVTYAFPIETWTSKDVEIYLEELGVRLPAYYAEGLTSAPDCLHCTGWLQYKALPYIDKHHPQAAKTVRERLSKIKVVVDSAYSQLSKAVENGK